MITAEKIAANANQKPSNLMADISDAERAEDAKHVKYVREFISLRVEDKPYDQSELRKCVLSLNQLGRTVEEHLQSDIENFREYKTLGGDAWEGRLENEISELHEELADCKRKFQEYEQGLNAVLTKMRVINGGQSGCRVFFTDGINGRMGMLRKQIQNIRTFKRLNPFLFETDLAEAAKCKALPVSLAEAGRPQELHTGSSLYVPVLPE